MYERDQIKEQILLTSNESAKYLSISPRSLWSLKASGKLAHVKIGRMIRFQKVDLDEFIQRHKQGGSR